MECKTEHCSEKPCTNGFALVSNPTNPTTSTYAMDVCAESEDTKSEELNNDNLDSEIPSLQQLLKEVYQKRILAVDSCEVDSSRKNEEKLKILQTYLQQLEEQNDVLISTMIELEKEAQLRVKQMEKRLKSSAKSTMEAVVNVHDCEQEMRRLVNERLHIESILDNMQHYLSTLKVENGFLRDQNFNLNHDIQALLHVIHHARTTGHWEMDCVTFCEVTPEQVFGPVQSLSELYPPDSPQSDSQLSKVTEKEQKILVNFELSSQDVSHSSMSSPSGDATLGIGQMTGELDNMQFLQEAHNEILKKDETIAILESHLAEVSRQLTVKEAECECHLWKLETLSQQNRTRNDSMFGTEIHSEGLHVCDMSLPKCISLPDIGNIYSYANVIRKSHSCRTILENAQRLNIRLPTKASIHHARQGQIRAAEETANQPGKSFASKSPQCFGFRKAQSEPHLFMFGDSIYVYRPCEQIKRASNVALHDDYQLSLPPCQSIDLKFPTDNINLKACDWDFIHNPHSYSVPVNSSPPPSHKIDASSSSCATSESEDVSHSKDISCNIVNRGIDPYFSSVQENCTNYQHTNGAISSVLCSSEKYCDNVHKHSKSVSTTSCHVQTENRKVVTYTIGLQADIKEEESPDTNILKDNGLIEMDIGKMSKRMQVLKDSLVKAEDKAAAKEILIEQLQGHLTAAVKEIEMKDEALSNIEKKLNASRSECASFKQQMSSLESEMQQLLNDLDHARLLNDNFCLNVDARKEQIEEIREEQKILQNQKRALMTQLDAQGDELQDAKREIEIMKMKAQSSTVQIEQQNQIIKNLQEALVQSKRAFDAAHPKKTLMPLNAGSNLQTKDRQFSKSSIVDI